MSEETFSIRVVDEEGDGIEGVKVSCNYGLLNGIGEEYTDEDGWARFTIHSTSFVDGKCHVKNIWINGDEVSGETKYMDDGDTLSYTI